MLRGVKVVELAGRTSIRIAGRLLAAHGAEVIRIAGAIGASGDDHPGLTVSEAAVAVAWDTGKEIRFCNPDTAPSVLAEALESADIVLTSGEGPPGPDPFVHARLGVGFSGIHVHLTPFGLTGPYAGSPGTELTTAAYGGLAVFVGEADREPLVPPMMLGANLAGAAAATAALAALYGDRDQQVDIAEVDVVATNPIVGLYSLGFYSGPVPRRAGRRKPNPYPFTTLPCKNGDVCVAFLGGHHWRALLEAMGNPAWAEDPRFQDRRHMGEHHADELDRLVSDWLRLRTKDELFSLAGSRDIPFGPLLTAGELLGNQHLDDRGFFDSTTVDGRAVRLPRYPARPVFAQSAEPTRCARTGKSSAPDREARGPLAGLRVVDLGWVVSAPMVGQFLTDMGADVIKVESRSFLDPARLGLPLLAEDVASGDQGLTPNAMPHYNNVNRGKRSISLNLRTSAGRQVLERLIDDADVVLENMGAGSLERLGLSIPDWQERRPGLVVLRISMMGQIGRDAQVPGFAPQATAMGGLDALCGYSDGAVVGMISTNLGDIAVAMHGIVGVLAALHHAGRTGLGTTLDLSMLEANAMALAPFFTAMQLGAAPPRQQGNQHRSYEPHGLFPTADGGWVALAVRSPQEWTALCDLLDVPEAIRRLSSPEERRARRETIDELITAWTIERTDRDAFDELRGSGVPAAPALGPEELLFDDHARTRGCVVDLDHHLVGYLPIYGTPFHGDPPFAWVRGRAPDLGEHTVQVLTELGLDRAEMAALQEAGAFNGVEVSTNERREEVDATRR